MNETSRARLVAYGVAVLATAVSLLMREYLLSPVMGDTALHITFCPAVLIAAYFGGFRPGLLATFLNAVAADFFFVEPRYSFWIDSVHDALAMLFFVLTGIFISVLCESLHRSRRRIVANERRYAITLSSIGDAVIATDKQARVAFMNPVAETLTGWPQADAAGRPLAEIFRIINEQTRQPVEDPGTKVLRLGAVGLANHTLLLARDGREVPIDDSGTPIIDDRDDITGVVLVFRDTTAHRESEKRFRTFVDHATDAFFLLDETGVVLDVNRQACASLGHTRDELLGMSPFKFDPDLTKAGLEERERKLSEGQTIAFESHHRRKDGTIFSVEVRGQAFWEGGRRFTVALARDITDRKRAEEALRESEQRWRNLTEALPQLVWTANADGACDYFSTQLTQYTGRAESELLPWGWMDVLHPDDRERTRNSWIEATAKERNHEIEHRIRSSNGEYRWFTTRGVPIRDAAGRIVKWFGTCTDTTEHKRSEQALRESEQRWRSLTEALPQLVWTATPDGACDYFSTQWTQFTGVPEIHLLGWQWMEVLHPDDREPTRQFWMNSVAGRGPYDVEYRVRRTDGEYRWFKTRGVPIQDSEGRTCKWFGTCTDITDAKRAEEALRESEERFRGTFETAAVGITHCDAQGRFLRVNEKYCEIVGYSREELLNRAIKDQSHPDDLAATLEKYNPLIRGELSSEIRMATP